jgi:hypothetical protein
MSSLGTSTQQKSPGVDLPQDFDTCFPLLNSRIQRFCEHHEWDVRYVEGTKLRAQGLIDFREEGDGTLILDRVQDEGRIALATLYASVASLFIQPSSLVDEDNTEVAVTYVCSMIAREKLSGESKDYLRVALKGGDGGKAVFHGRLYYLTRSGSSAMKLVIEAVEKLLGKFVREIPNDRLTTEVVEQVKNRAFTSLDGMLDNSYRTTRVASTRQVRQTDRRGRTITAPVRVMKQHKIVPDLTAAKAPLKPQELTRLNQLRDSFNDRKAEVMKRIGRLTSPTLFDTPKVCIEVTAEAYSKLQGFKAILRDRTAGIRERAMQLNDGNKPGPGHWVTAKSELLREAPDIPEAIWNDLRWDQLE